MRPLLALLAGFSALGAEIVFTRRCELLLGNTGMIVAAVLCSHLLGLAAGSFLARRSARLSDQPYRVFGLAQIAQAILIWLVDFLLPYLSGVAAGQLPLRLTLILFLLFLPAAAAGYAFPALVALYGGDRRVAGGDRAARDRINGVFSKTGEGAFTFEPRLLCSGTLNLREGTVVTEGEFLLFETGVITGGGTADLSQNLRLNVINSASGLRSLGLSWSAG